MSPDLGLDPVLGMPTATLSSLSSQRSAPPAEIATVPPVRPDEVGYARSGRTGEPRRPMVLMAAIVSCWVSVAVTVAAFGWWWWQVSTVDGFHASARVLTWTHPDPVSALAIVMVLVVGVIAVLMVAAAGMVAYNSWAGSDWIRIGGLIAVAVTGLSFLLSWWFSAAMIPLAVGVVLLWLRPVGRFFQAMRAFRGTTSVVVPTSGVRYGPQPLIGGR